MNFAFRCGVLSGFICNILLYIRRCVCRHPVDTPVCSEWECSLSQQYPLLDFSSLLWLMLPVTAVVLILGGLLDDIIFPVSSMGGR